MKSIARMSLEKGMVLADDITNYKGDVLLAKGTVVDEQVLKKLERHSVMCVDIMEEIDYASTHFEKIRLSDEFKNFEKTYREQMSVYRKLMSDFVNQGILFEPDRLNEIYDCIRVLAPSGPKLLDFLYNMLPDEDELTHTHCLNSALIAGVFADWMGMDSADKKELIQCGFLYDIGKLKLSDALLWKPDKLTELEYMQIKTHTLMGYSMLENLPVSEKVKRCALMHHERCDGSGYPSKLNWLQIDLYARYMAIIDTYEAMTSPRAYRESLTPLQVIANFEAQGHGTYDEELLRPFLRRLADSQIGLTVRLSDDTKWEVFIISPDLLSRPILKRGEELLNLREHPELKVIAIY